MTREKSQAVLRHLFTDAQDAPPSMPVSERIALTAVDELERALARNAILERTVKRLEFRLTAMEGAAQGLSRRLMACYTANPENAKLITALNEEAALGQAIAAQEREKKAAPFKRVTCRCGHRTQRLYGYDCEHCKQWTCEQCHKDGEGRCASCGGLPVHDPS